MCAKRPMRRFFSSREQSAPAGRLLTTTRIPLTSCVRCSAASSAIFSTGRSAVNGDDSSAQPLRWVPDRSTRASVANMCAGRRFTAAIRRRPRSRSAAMVAGATRCGRPGRAERWRTPGSGSAIEWTINRLDVRSRGARHRSCRARALSAWCRRLAGYLDQLHGASDISALQRVAGISCARTHPRGARCQQAPREFVRARAWAPARARLRRSLARAMQLIGERPNSGPAGRAAPSATDASGPPVPTTGSG